QTCCTVRRRGWAVAVGRKFAVRRPNKSFKPKPLPYAKHMADTACHVFRSTTRLGLTQVLGLVSRTVVAGFQAICSVSLIRSVCTSHARCTHRQSALQQLGFGHVRLSARFDWPSRLRKGRSESSWPHESLVLASTPTYASLRPIGKTCCNVRLGGWAVARPGASSARGGLTSRSSRSRFVTQTTRQVELAMCFAPLRVSA